MMISPQLNMLHPTSLQPQQSFRSLCPNPSWISAGSSPRMFMVYGVDHEMAMTLSSQTVNKTWQIGISCPLHALRWHRRVACTSNVLRRQCFWHKYRCLPHVLYQLSGWEHRTWSSILWCRHHPLAPILSSVEKFWIPSANHNGSNRCICWLLHWHSTEIWMPQPLWKENQGDIAEYLCSIHTIPVVISPTKKLTRYSTLYSNDCRKTPCWVWLTYSTICSHVRPFFSHVIQNYHPLLIYLPSLL